MNIVSNRYRLESCRLGSASWLVVAVALCLLGAAIAIYVPRVLPAAALNVGEAYITADYLAAMIAVLALEAFILLLPVRYEDKGSMLLLWMLKGSIILIFMPIYEAHYTTLDAKGYFIYGTSLDAADVPSFGDGTEIANYMVYLATRILPSYFHLLEVVWGFIGLLAIFLFYRGFRLIFINTTPRLLLVIGLFPDILVWSSILGKDPLVLFGISLYFYGVAQWIVMHRLSMLAIAALGIAIATAIRPWLVVILVAPMIAFPLTGMFRGWQKALILAVVGIAAYFAIVFFLSDFEIVDTQDLAQTTNHISQGFARGGSVTNTPTFGGVGGMFTFLPLGMFTALFRPLPGDGGSAFMLISSAFNLFLLFYLILALKRTSWQALQRAPILWMILLILIWSAMYAFPSSQNLGTAVRYRLQILPVMWPLLWLLSHRDSSVSQVPCGRTT